MKLKYFLLIFSAFTITAAAIAGLSKYFSNSNSAEIAQSGDEGSTQPLERMKWEQMRLCDPATGHIPANIHRQELAFAATLPGYYKNINTKYLRLLSNRWNQRGPANIGGRTRALALDILNENNIIAGGVSGGMWLSTDAGQTWTKTTKPDQIHSVSCLKQDTRPGKENIWYYGTGEFWGNSAHINGDGIYKSTDGGRSWFSLASTVRNTPQSWDNPFEYVWNIAIDHTNLQLDIVYAATSVGGIYRSTDGGETWKSVLGGFGNTYSFFTDVEISPSGVLYATLSQKTFEGTPEASVHGIFRSIDGVNWTKISPEFMPPTYNRIVIGIAPSDESQVYFLAETPGYGKWTTNSRGDDLWDSFWKYNYLSGDGSGSEGEWEDRSENIPKPEYVRGHFNPQGSYNLIVKVKPDNPDVVIFGGTNLYRSTDGLKTSDNTSWIGGYNPNSNAQDIYTYDNHHADLHEVIFSRSDPNVMFTGSDGGVHKTLNNLATTVEWISLNNSYLTTQFYTVAIDHAPGGSDEIIGGLQDNGTLYTNSTNPQKAWTAPTYADGFCCAIADSGKAYYSAQNSSYQPMNKIWRIAIDKDGNRTIRTRIDPIGGRDFIWVTPFRLDPNDNNVMYLAGGEIIWRNNNLSLIPAVESKDSTSIGWDSLSATRVDSGSKITAIKICKTPANILYYGTSKGKVYRLNSARIGNPNPQDITGANFPSGAYVSCIAADPENAARVFVVFSNYSVLSIFYSDDVGETWTPISGNLEEYISGSGTGPAVNWVEVLPIAGKYMYFAGTSTGLYSTAFLDGENTVWEQEGALTIGNVVVDMLDTRASDGYIVAATHGAGMFSANITTLPTTTAKPVLLAPAIGTKGVNSQITLEWKPVDGAGFYRLEVSKTPDFSTIFYEKDGLKQTSNDVSSLEQGLVKYYWRVRARNAAGLSNFSDVWTFTTNVSSPILLYPDDKQDSLPTSFTLKWDAVEGADSYHIQVARSFNFQDPAADTVVSGTTLEISGLLDKTRYYWHVSGIAEGMEGVNSTRRSFVTAPSTSVKDWKKIENPIALLQNYPNPAYYSTTIKFILNKGTNINLRIYDSRGGLLQKLSQGYLYEGEYNISVDVSKFSQGKYFYEISGGDFSAIGTLVVLK